MKVILRHGRTFLCNNSLLHLQWVPMNSDWLHCCWCSIQRRESFLTKIFPNWNWISFLFGLVSLQIHAMTYNNLLLFSVIVHLSFLFEFLFWISFLVKLDVCSTVARRLLDAATLFPHCYSFCEDVTPPQKKIAGEIITTRMRRELRLERDVSKLSESIRVYMSAEECNQSAKYTNFPPQFISQHIF